MAAATTTITNVSDQVIPVLVGSIDSSKANSSSDIPASDARQVSIAPGSEIVVETQRLDLGQLERLQNLKVITYQ